MTHRDSDNTTARADMIRELRRGIAMIHAALADSTRPRQSCGEVAAWWLRYADGCVDALSAAPHTAREMGGEQQANDAGKWYTAYDEDAELCNGPHDTRAAAISYGQLNYDDHFFIILAGEKAEQLSAWIGAEDIIERANEAILDSERCNPDADDDAIFDPTPEQEADLTQRIKAVCDEWQAAHGLRFTPRTFGWVEICERIEVTHG